MEAGIAREGVAGVGRDKVGWKLSNKPTNVSKYLQTSKIVSFLSYLQ